ncbi:MAG: hypothetical protein WD069_00705 [Planctomycetales bacterium]
MQTLRTLWADEAGFVVSAELVLVLTIGVLAMVVGLHAVAKSITMELNDVATAFGTIDQSFSYLGLTKSTHASVPGSAFQDRSDACDCSIITQPAPAIKIDPSGSHVEST